MLLHDGNLFRALDVMAMSTAGHLAQTRCNINADQMAFVSPYVHALTENVLVETAAERGDVGEILTRLR
jgi:hypothetical protein